MAMELVKMSAKGQLVVPQELRETAGFEVGDRFVPFKVEGGILFKKVEMPDIKAEFENLSKEVEAKFKKAKVSKKDVSEAIKWARK